MSPEFGTVAQEQLIAGIKLPRILSAHLTSAHLRKSRIHHRHQLLVIDKDITPGDMIAPGAFPIHGFKNRFALLLNGRRGLMHEIGHGDVLGVDQRRIGAIQRTAPNNSGHKNRQHGITQHLKRQ